MPNNSNKYNTNLITELKAMGTKSSQEIFNEIKSLRNKVYDLGQELERRGYKFYTGSDKVHTPFKDDWRVSCVVRNDTLS